MYKLLAASALSLALLSGTAIAQVSVGGNTTGSAGVTVGGSSGGSADGDADAELKLNAEAEATVDTDELDTETTAAIGADAEITAVLDGFGDDADAFFEDEARTQLKSEAEIQAAFNALTPEQQQELLTICGEASGSGGGSAGGASAGGSGSAGICAAIENL